MASPTQTDAFDRRRQSLLEAALERPEHTTVVRPAATTPAWRRVAMPIVRGARWGAPLVALLLALAIVVLSAHAAAARPSVDPPLGVERPQDASGPGSDAASVQTRTLRLVLATTAVAVDRAASLLDRILAWLDRVFEGAGARLAGPVYADGHRQPTASTPDAPPWEPGTPDGLLGGGARSVPV